MGKMCKRDISLSDGVKGNPMKTGIVILNYNDGQSVISLADKIADYGVLDNIVIVDNASTDGSLSVLQKKYRGKEKITVVSSGKNGGYSYGNNFGIQYLIEHYGTQMIVVANPDVIFEEDLLTAMGQVFEKYPEYGILSGVMTRPDGTVDPAPYREMFSYARDLGDCFLLVRRLVYEKKRYEVDYSQAVQTVPVIQGSFFAITADAYRKTGGLDENIFLYYEELILAKKLERAGLKSGLITGKTYLHNHSVSIRKSMKNLKIWRTVLKSKYYYQKQYNNANFLQMGLLYVCGVFSIIEKFIVEVLRKL